MYRITKDSEVIQSVHIQLIFVHLQLDSLISYPFWNSFWYGETVRMPCRSLICGNKIIQTLFWTKSLNLISVFLLDLTGNSIHHQIMTPLPFN